MIYTLNMSDLKNVTILFPGSFKPIHIGHMNLIEKYLNDPLVKEIKIFIGPGIRDNIDSTLSLKIMKLLWPSYKENDITIDIVKYPSPILTCYKFIETAPIGNYAIASSSKGKDAIRIKEFVNNFNVLKKYTKPEGVNIIEFPVDITPLCYTRRTDDKNGTPISSTILRQDIANNDYENFKTHYLGYDENIILNVWWTIITQIDPL